MSYIKVPESWRIQLLFHEKDFLLLFFWSWIFSPLLCDKSWDIFLHCLRLWSRTVYVREVSRATDRIKKPPRTTSVFVMWSEFKGPHLNISEVSRTISSGFSRLWIVLLKTVLAIQLVAPSMPQGGIAVSVSSFQVHCWLGCQQDCYTFTVLSEKSLMMKYTLAIGLTDLRFQEFGNYWSASSLNCMASESCTSEDKIQAVEIASSLALSAFLHAYINSKYFIMFYIV